MRGHHLVAWILRLSRSMANRHRHWRKHSGRVIVASAVLAALVAHPAMLRAWSPVRSTDLDISRAEAGEGQGPAPVHVSVYDQFLKRFRTLRANAAHRHYLLRQVVAAANQNRIDPDLLFALVAVESNFNRVARSRKGARGLGQMMYTTAHSLAPRLVRHPADLYNAHRNLYVTALLLRQLLIEQGGDLQAALTAYHLGPGDGRLARRVAEHYVGRICTYFASLKARQEFRALIAVDPDGTGADLKED